MFLFQLGGLFSKQFKQKFVLKYRYNPWDRIWRTRFPCGLCLPLLVLPSSAKAVQTCQREASWFDVWRWRRWSRRCTNWDAGARRSVAFSTERASGILSTWTIYGARSLEDQYRWSNDIYGPIYSSWDGWIGKASQRNIHVLAYPYNDTRSDWRQCHWRYCLVGDWYCTWKTKRRGITAPAACEYRSARWCGPFQSAWGRGRPGDYRTTTCIYCLERCNGCKTCCSVITTATRTSIEMEHKWHQMPSEECFEANIRKLLPRDIP